ncbi:uncharacterized protein [Hemitrygon akajei]|uniref:uncharacterized protein n=1 Tax=Hemitrygon akajei TaxID=2704970 RepID=UPI003BFA191B
MSGSGASSMVVVGVDPRIAEDGSDSSEHPSSGSFGILNSSLQVARSADLSQTNKQSFKPTIPVQPSLDEQQSLHVKISFLSSTPVQRSTCETQPHRIKTGSIRTPVLQPLVACVVIKVSQPLSVLSFAPIPRTTCETQSLRLKISFLSSTPVPRFTCETQPHQVKELSLGLQEVCLTTDIFLLACCHPEQQASLDDMDHNVLWRCSLSSLPAAMMSSR